MRFVLTRIETPRVDQIAAEALDAEVGGQWSWCWATALPYRAIASPTTGSPMPAFPRDDQDIFGQVGYWCSLQSFLTYSLGWMRHDRGLRRWYESGKPTEDPRFALIEEIWGRDGVLLAYAEWWSSHREGFSSQPLSRWSSYDPSEDAVSPKWTTRLRAARNTDELAALSPYGKHLEHGHHASGPAVGEYVAEFSGVDHERRHAILTCETVFGWYRALHEDGAGLPSLADHSWHIDVWVKQIGFIGTYRQSRQTGLWFSGKHRYHSMGN